MNNNVLGFKEEHFREIIATNKRETTKEEEKSKS